jgi:hypothetical protein
MFLRGVNNKSDAVNELLTTEAMKGTETGENLFERVVISYCEAGKCDHRWITSFDR